jgi:alpha-galactosidase
MRALFRFGFFALFPFAASVRAEPADLTKPVQVFILLGQSNMVGLGKVTGPDGSLEHAVKAKKKYPYLVDAAGAWTARDDVRYVRVMVGRAGGMQVFNDEWLKAGGRNLGPELGIGHPLGDAISAPVMLLKSCIGNRSLGWDLLPPGSPRTLHDGKVYPAYKERPDSWAADPAKGVETPPPLPWVDKKGKPIDWYAGKQYDYDVANAKRILADLKKHYPGASHYEVAGFFFWQGEKDGGNAAHAAEYEANLVRFIRRLRQDFETPRAKFVLATLGEAVKGSGGNGGKILEAQLAVDGESGKHPEFKGNVATVYAHPLSKGGSGNSHYNGNAETYMEVGEAMGLAMADLLKK